MCIPNCRKLSVSIMLAVLLVAGMFLLANIPSARADGRLLFVRPDGAGTACTQASPCALQTALAQAGDGDTIYLAQGTYTGTGAAVITITSSIALYGGWNGAAGGPVARDPAQYPTVLDGEGARRVVHISGDITPTLDGLIITRGNATGLTMDCPNVAGNPDGCGGGIFVYKAHPIIVGNIITNNIAAISTAGYPTGTTGYGGGIYLRNADRAVISGNVVISNAGSTAASGYGGGISLYGSGFDLLVQGNQVLSNTAGVRPSSWGGGIAGGPHGARIVDNLIQDNWGTPIGGGMGAGIYQWYGSAEYLRNVIRENHGDSTVYLGYSSSRFEGNHIVDNTSQTGVHLTYGPGPTLVNNLVFHSAADRTVSVYAYAGAPITVTLLHNTLVGSVSGSGVSVNSGYATIFLTNNIIVNHTWGITNPFPVSSTVLADHTLFWGNTNIGIEGTNPVFGDPRLLPDGYHLGPGSAAVDAGVDAGVMTDMDGDPRPIGAGFDIGADEFMLRDYLPVILRRR